MRKVWGLAMAAAVVMVTTEAASGDRMVFHAESRTDRRVVASRGADTSFNPASVLKVATSLLALRTLGPDYRYETVFSCRGTCAITDGVLDGDLVIHGGGDPDFQAENAWLVAEELKRAGIRSIAGDLVVEGIFYQGWEHGVEHRRTDPVGRSRLMGDRFLSALDATRWDSHLEASWEDAVVRHGWSPEARPTITLAGGIRSAEGVGTDRDQELVRHRSNPLRTTLFRFNTFSNNDIVRVADAIGGPAAIASLVREVAGGEPGAIVVATASGERVNRLTARQTVSLLWAFATECRSQGLTVGDVLPLPGCVPGSLPRMFPRLADGDHARTAVVKSGSLTTTDGGVAVLAGFFTTKAGDEIAFCVAAPRAGSRLHYWRLAEQDWLIELMEASGGARPRTCGPPLPFSDEFAAVTGAKKPLGEDHVAR